MAVTTQDVVSAINQLTSQGTKVTQAKVLEITGGSASTINKIFKELNANSDNTAALPKAITLPSNVISALGDFLDTEIAKARQDLIDANIDLGKVNDAVAKEAEELGAKVEILEPKLNEIQLELDKAKTIIEERDQQLRAAHDAAAAKEAAAETTRNELAVAKVSLKTAEKTIADLEAKIKASAQQVIDAVKDKTIANEARIAAEKAAAIAEVKTKNAEDNAKKAETREAELKKKFDELNKQHIDSINKSNTQLNGINSELAKALADAKDAATKNSELQKQLDAVKQELAAAKKAAEPAKKAS